MRKPLALVLLAALFASGAGAAPLCHDLKGLFTPCVVKPAQKHRQGSAQAELAPHPAMVTEPMATVHPHRSLFSKGRLCRDSKGRAEPCT